MRRHVNREALLRRDALSKYMKTTRNVTELDFTNHRATSNEIRIALLECLTSFCSLTHVNVTGNCLADIPRTLTEQCTNLTNLDLSCNNLTRVPAHFRHLTNLEVLLLSGNGLVYIAPEALGALVHLRKLDVTMNIGLRYLPPVFHKLTQLTAVATYGTSIDVRDGLEYTTNTSILQQRFYCGGARNATIAVLVLARRACKRPGLIHKDVLRHMVAPMLYASREEDAWRRADELEYKYGLSV